MTTQEISLINGRYKRHEALGFGGMGIVYRATDRLTGKEVALKYVHLSSEQFLSTSFTPSKTDRSLKIALAKEFQILAGLHHPHIISVLDYGFDAEQQPFFTMTYLPDAQTILEAGANLDTTGKLDLVRQMLQALAYLYRRGIIHHDLKPSNVLVTKQRARVLDFGLSTRWGAELASGGGSLLYMAPEILRWEPASHASDLYAVGVMAYELFAGIHPFKSANGKFAYQVQYKAPDLSQLPLDPALVKVIERLLAKQPENRYESAETCLAAIGIALGEATPRESEAIRESYLQAATFVGRETELTQLQTALAGAKEGQGTVWLIGGESGVGKSRLVEEFRIQALVAGWQVLTGQAIAEGGLPYHLWQDIIPHLALSTDLSDLEAGILHEVVPIIAHLLERDISSPSQLQGQAAQQRLSQTLISVIQQQTKPTLLLLEDLQWARESLTLVKHILNKISQLSGVMILGTYRNDERPELPETLTGAQVILLDRLGMGEIMQLSQAMLGVRASTPEIVTLLHKETEGNTFFIVEVMRALAEEAGQLDEIGTMTLPAGVFTRGMQHLLQRRIQKVPQADQGLLQLAAVAGRQLDLAVLHLLAKDKYLGLWLQHGSDAMVLTVWEDQWSFAHDKLRETILATLTDENRRILHRQVAETIEQVYPNDGRYYQTLLQHWHQAGDLDKEMVFLPLVAQHLVEVTAGYVSVRKLLKRGLQALPANDTRRVSLWNWLAESHNRQGNYAQAQVLTQQARELAQQTGDLPGLAKSLYNLGNLAHNLGNFSQSLDYHQQSLVIFQELGDQQGIGSALREIGQALTYMSHYKSAQDYFQQGLIIFQKIEDQLHEAFIHNDLGLLAYRQGDYERARDYCQRSLAIRQTIGTESGISYSLTNLGFIYLRLNHAQARRTFRDALTIAQSSLATPLILEIMVGVAWLYLQQDNPIYAGELAGLAHHHPMSTSYVQAYLDEFLPLLKDALKPDDLQAAFERGQTLDFDHVVQKLLTEFSEGVSKDSSSN